LGTLLIKKKKKEFYKNGQIKKLYHIVNKKKDGEYKEFSKDGQEIVVYNYVNGKIDGLAKIYTEHLYKEKNYKNGYLDGVQFVYFDNILVKKYYCKKNKLHGEYILYNSKKEPEAICLFVNGLLEGKLIHFDLSGNKKAIYNFKKGKLHGESIVYNELTYMIGYFREGTGIKKWKRISRDGKEVQIFQPSETLSRTSFKYRDLDLTI